MNARTYTESEISAALKLPLPLYGVLIRRAQMLTLPRTANALAELARVVERSGLPQAVSSWQAKDAT